MAGAVNYWQGTTGNFQTAGNWTDGDPDAGDEIIFDSRVSQSVTEGMLPSETGNVAYDMIHVKSGFTGDIGSAAEPLAIGTATGDNMVVIHEGSGALHLCCSLATDAGGTDAVIPTVILNGTGSLYLYSQDNDAANTSSFTNVYACKGTLYLATEEMTGATGDSVGPAVTNLYICPQGGTAANVTVTIVKESWKENGDVATNIYMANGTLTSDSPIGVFHHWGGTVHFGTDGSNPTVVPDITTLVQYGGTLNWNPDGTTPEIVTCYLFGGTLQCSTSVNEDNARTLGGGSNLQDVFLYPGATLDIRTGRSSVTLGAGAQFFNLGGTFMAESFDQIAFTHNADPS